MTCTAAPTCPWCGRDAELLCDAVLGRKPSWPETPITLEDIDEGRVDWWTCDLPVCHECARTVAHICARGDHASCDTVDVCPIHRRESALPHYDLPILTEAQSNAMRRRNAIKVGRLWAPENIPP